MSFRVDRLFWTLFVSREFLDTGLPLYVDSASIEFAHTTNITYRPFETELECPDSIVGRVLRYALERVKCIAIEERDVDKLKAHSVDALYEVAKNIVRFDIFTSRMVCWHERDSSVGMGYFYELDDDQLDVHKDEGVPRKVITPAQLAALMETKSFLKDNMTWNMRVRCLASSSITFGNRAGIWAREHHWAVSVRCLLAGDSGNRELTMVRVSHGASCYLQANRPSQDLNIDLRTRDTISISTSIGQLEKR